MNLSGVRPVVDAVLYEGYILYPYRSTATKNRSRWTFGGIYPEAYFDATGGCDPCHMQTQCLIEGGTDTRVEVLVRFLQPVSREVGRLAEPLNQWSEHEGEFEHVPSLSLGGTTYHAWQEAMERDVEVVKCSLGELAAGGKTHRFGFQAGCQSEPLSDDDGLIAGLLLRRQAAVQGRIDVTAEAVANGIYRLGVRIENTTPMDPGAFTSREEASLYSFASTHTILGADNGAFISLMDPPAALKEAAGACDNQGAYPVLIGESGERDTMLSSPIILYDYPEVAPESPGDLFDATEIDELLSLTILAMTDQEKSEMAATDPRAAALLARTEALDGDDFMRMHGTLRDPADTTRAAGIKNPGIDPLQPQPCRPYLAYYDSGSDRIKVGDHVRLRPGVGGDVMDLLLDGKTAVIESIERDFEDRVHLAVALDDDPGREWGLQRMPGHRFFFSPEEIEPLEPTGAGEVGR